MTAPRQDPPLPRIRDGTPAQQAPLQPVDSLAGRRGVRAYRWRRGLAWAAFASLALHGALLAGLLPRGGGEFPLDVPPQEVELVNEASQRQGGAAPAGADAGDQQAEADAAPQPPSAATETPPQPPQPTAPPTELGQGGVPMPLPYRPSPPPRQASAAQGSPGRSAQPDPPQVNLGDEEDREGLRVTSDDFVPPQPDAARRNEPPRYPPDAIRRGARGTVQLRVRVTETGRPLTVLVDRSSGDASLDRSATEAVMRWRFTPAKRGGVAVPFDYYISVHFGTGKG